MRKKARSSEIQEVLKFYYAAAKRADRARATEVGRGGETSRRDPGNPVTEKPRRIRQSSYRKRLRPGGPNRGLRF
jgi:hypothetical protein